MAGGVTGGVAAVAGPAASRVVADPAADAAVADPVAARRYREIWGDAGRYGATPWPSR